MRIRVKENFINSIFKSRIALIRPLWLASIRDIIKIRYYSSHDIYKKVILGSQIMIERFFSL